MRASDHRYCKIDAKTIPKRPNSAPCVGLPANLRKPCSCGRNAPNPAVDGQDPDFRSAALPGAAQGRSVRTVFALHRRPACSGSRLAIAVTFLQIFVGVLRWREISAECGAPLELGRAMRYNVIGAVLQPDPAVRDRRRCGPAVAGRARRRRLARGHLLDLRRSRDRPRRARDHRSSRACPGATSSSPIRTDARRCCSSTSPRSRAASAS